jgi:catechol 2,3-dioxygenase-like lactoylglutathione lyase family enzyme
MIPAGRTIMQNAYVVNDVEEAAWRWVKTMGVGPFLINRHLQIGDPFHRGQPGGLDFSIAIAQAGPVQIELIQQHCDSPSCYRDLYPRGREGFHHVAVVVDDYDAQLAHYAAAGFQIASGGVMGDMRFCYVDTSASIGNMVELVEDKPLMRAFMAAVAGAAETWDGRTDPVRPFG